MDPRASFLSSLPASRLAPLHPIIPLFISGVWPGHGFPLCNSFCCFCAGQQGWSSQRVRLRDMERNVWAKDKSCMKPSVSLLSVAFPSAVRFPRRLSGYQRVYSTWWRFLASHFQRETWGARFPPPHSHGDSWSNRKWKDVAGWWEGVGCSSGGGGAPCFIHPSKWEDMAAFMPARGGNLVKRWKEGASLYHTPADWDVPHTGKAHFGVDLRCTRRLQPLGSTSLSQTPTGMQWVWEGMRGGGEVDIPLDGI